MLGRRGASLLLALAIEALVVLLLLFLVPPTPGTRKASNPSVFSVDTDADNADADAPAKADKAKPMKPAEARRPVPPPPPPVPPPPVPIQQPRGPLPFIVMTHQEYRAAQIANLPSRSAEPAAAAPTAASSRLADTAMAPGKGPHGEPLYAAEWYVRPTKAQLQTYISSRARDSGWGLIACRTIANYRVEDCQELGESPRGSGFAGSVRQAAWQFRVRPPRIGGKDMVGEWVAIHVDYTMSRD